MLSRLIFLCLFFASPFQYIQAKDVYYNLKISYYKGAPDGVPKKILAANNQVPGPTIHAFKGDTLHVTVTNLIQDKQGTSIHWHGIFHKSTPFEDGASLVTQCPIPYGKSQIYTFPLKQSGTYWWHSHVSGQYGDGLWGPLIIYDPYDPYRKDYDEEIVISVNDWYHRSYQEGQDWFLSRESKGNEPIPDSILINGVGKYPCYFAGMQNLPCNPKQKRKVFQVTRGKRYRFRLINTSSLSAYNFSIDGHSMKVIGADGTATVPVNCDVLKLDAAQRYSFIVKMNGDPGTDQFWIRVGVQTDMYPDGPNINQYPEALIIDVRAVLKYTNGYGPYGYSTSSIPETLGHDPSTAILLNEMDLTPFDGDLSPPKYDSILVLQVTSVEDQEGVNHLTFNNSIYTIPASQPPILALALQNRPLPASANLLHLKHKHVVQIVINNEDTGGHPFHIHGHDFWVLGSGDENDGDYNSDIHGEKLKLNGVRRDTVHVQPKSWVVIRLIAENPGVWLFHCHINWHFEAGLAALLIEAPDKLQGYKIPREAKKICGYSGVSLSYQ